MRMVGGGQNAFMGAPEALVFVRRADLTAPQIAFDAALPSRTIRRVAPQFRPA